MLSFLIACAGPATSDALTADAPATSDTGPPPPTGTASGDSFCAVRRVFEQCTTCHLPPTAEAGLDLTTDPRAAVVGVPSALYEGRTLVVPGDPEASFLYLKVRALQAGDEGNPMPPFVGLPDADAERFRAWIAAGAPGRCDPPATDSGGSGAAG